MNEDESTYTGEDTDINDPTTTVNKSKSETKAEDEAINNSLYSKEEEEVFKDYAAQMISGYAKPAIAESMVNKDKFFDIYGDRFLKESNGNKTKANEAMDRTYEMISKEYQNKAEEENNFKMLESVSFLATSNEDIEFITNESYVTDMGLVAQNINDRKEMLDTFTNPTRTIREASLESKKVLDYKGEIINYKDDAYSEIALNKKYTNADGKTIIGFKYIQYNPSSRNANIAIQAIYEGESLGLGEELVSRYDTSDSFLKNNGLDTSTWKVAVGSVLDFVVDFVDTMFAFNEYLTTQATFGLASDTELFKTSEDLRLLLKSAMTSTSERDQQSLLTINNAVDTGINIAAQLLLGRAVATGMSKIVGVGVKQSERLFALSKELDVTKKLYQVASSAAEKKTIWTTLLKQEDEYKLAYKLFNTKSNIVKKTTLATMGMMQAKETGDMAKQLGFSDYEASFIYFAALGSMMYANSLSDFGFERLGLNNLSKHVKKSVFQEIVGIAPIKANIPKIISKTGAITNAVVNRVKTAITGSGMINHGIQESTQEGTEFIFDQLVRHAATGLSVMHYGNDAPKFKTVMDEGYFKDAGIELLLNMGVGAIAGAATGSIMTGHKKGMDESSLPQKGSTAEKLKYVAYHASRTQEGARLEQQLKKYIKKLRKKGFNGREDISSKWDSKNGRYKRVNELTKEDIANGHASQAEIQTMAILAQYEYYRHIYDNSDEKYEDITKNDPELGLIKNSKTMYEETRTIMEEKAILYAKSSASGNIDFDDNIKDLAKEKSKLKPDADGNIDDAAYQSKLAKYAEVTGLTTKDISRLMEINEQLEDIRQGKALGTSFIKHQFTNPRYKGRLEFNMFESLIGSDMEAQDNFKEDIKNSIEDQIANSKIVVTNIDEKGNMSEGLINMLLGNPEGILITQDAREKLYAGVNNIGKTLFEQKAVLYAKLLSDLTSRTKKVLDDNAGNIVDVDEEMDGKTLMDNVINDITNAAQIDDKAIQDVYSNHGNIQLNPITENTELGYILKKIYALSQITTEGAIKDISYQPDSIDKNTENNIMSGLEGMFGNEFGLQNISNVDLGNEQEGISILELMSEKENADFTSISDTKNKLNSIINRSREYTTDELRSDLEYGYIITPADKVSATKMSLEEQYDRLISGYVDKDGKIPFFPDIKSAQNLLDQINTRIAETEFILEFLPTLSKIDMLNKTVLNNDDPKSTFLTQYIEKYITPLEDFNKDPGPVYQQLKGALTRIIPIKLQTEELVTKAAEASEDLNEKYIGQAFTVANKDLNESVMQVINSADFDKVRENPLYADVFIDIQGKVNNIDWADRSASNLKAVYEIIYDVKSSLNNLYESTKDSNGVSKFIEDIKHSYPTTFSLGIYQRYAKLITYTMSPVDKVNKLLNTSITAILKGAEEDENLLHKAKLPSIEQIVWIEEISAAASQPDYLSTLAYMNAEDKPYTFAAFFSAQQGSGKTQVVLKYATDIVQEINIDRGNGTDFKGLVFAANNERQRDTMLLSKGHNTIVSDVLTNQQDIYDLLINSKLSIKKLADKLKNISTIFYDEITMVEFNGNKQDIENSRSSDDEDVKKAPVLNAILAKLEQINILRDDPIVFIGFGDETQQGFLRGSSSPRNVDANSTSIKSMHVLFSGNERSVFRSSSKLSTNYRSKVKGMSESITDFQKNMKGNVDGGLDETKFIYNEPGQERAGIELKRESFTSMANDEKLIADIKRKLDADEDFTVAIISGIDDASNSIHNLVDGKKTKLSELVEDKKYVNKNGFPRINLYSFRDVQGAEADYVLIDVPVNFFTVNTTDINSLEPDQYRIFFDRVTKLKTALGRAYTYARIAYSDVFDESVINSSDKGVVINTPKINIPFKKDWGNNLVGNILLYDENKSNTAKNAKPANVESTNKTKVDNVVNSGLTPMGTIKTGKYVEVDSEHDPKHSTIVVNDKGSKQNLLSLIKDIANKHNLDDLIETGSNEEIKNLISELKDMTQEDIPQNELSKLKKDIATIIDGKHIVYGITTNVEVIEDISNTIDRSTEAKENEDELLKNNQYISVNKQKNDTQRDHMRKAEVTENKITAYQDFQDRDGEINPASLRHKRLVQLYGNDAMSFIDSSIAVDAAVVAHNGIELQLNTDDYDFYLVSTIGKYKNSKATPYENHILVGEAKKGILKGKKFLFAQLPKLSDFAENGVTYSILKDKIDRLALHMESGSNDEYIHETITTNDVGSENEAYYIESLIKNPNTLVRGFTVGNLVTTDAYTLNKINKNNLIPTKDVVNGKINKTILNNKTFTNKLKNYKSKDGGWTEEVFKGRGNFTHENSPFIPTEITKTSAKIFRKIEKSKDIYTIIKTSKGNIPFLLDEETNQWVPVLGVDLNNKLYTDISLITSDSINFDKELQIVSNNLSGLDPKEHDKQLISNLNSDDANTDINTILNLNNVEISDVNTDSEVHKLFLKEYNSRKNKFLGNIKTPYSTAKKIWAKTSNINESQTTRPFVLTEGKHAGKAVIFYTSNKFIDLNSMTNKEFVELYKKIIINKNIDNKSLLTENRYGIGMLLLDSKGYNFSEILKLLPNAKLSKTTSAVVNKSIVSGKSKTILVELFSTIQKIVNENDLNQNKQLIDQLSSEDNYTNTVLDWKTANEKSHEFVVIKELFKKIFSSENTGKIEVTADINDDAIDALYQVEDIFNSNNSEEEKQVSLEGVLSEYKDALYELRVENTSQLKSIALRQGSDTGANGLLVMDNNGKAILRRTPLSIIVALDKTWATDIHGDASIVPNADFDMDNFIFLMNNIASKNKIDIEKVMLLLDPLLSEIGLEQGIFISPSVTVTSDPIAAVESTIGEETYETDVKRIKRPQVVLDTVIMQAKGELVETVNKNVVLEEDKELKTKSLLDDFNSKIQKANNKNDILFILNEVATNSIFNTTEKNNLYDLLSIRFTKMVPIPTGKNFHKINIESLFLPIPGTEEFLKSLNVLRDLTIDTSTLNVIWNSLIDYPVNFTKHQKLLLNKVINIFKNDDELDLQTTFLNIKYIYKNNLLTGITTTIKSDAILSTIKNIETRLSNDNYPTEFDLSPGDRVLLLMGLNTKDQDGNSIVNKVDRMHISMVYDPTKPSKLKKLIAWSTNALDIKEISIELQQLGLEKYNNINKDTSILSLDSGDISVILSALYENDLDNYVKFLSQIEKETTKFYYNVDNKIIIDTLIKSAFDLLENTGDETTVMNKTLNTIEKNILTNADPDTRALRDAGNLIKILTKAKPVIDLNNDARTVLDNVLSQMTVEQANNMFKYISNDFSKIDIENRLSEKIANNFNTLLLSVTDNINIAQDVVEAISELTSDEEFKCYV